MGRTNNHFKGVNKVCAQCVRDCKQFENVVLINCPKFRSSQSENPLPYSYVKSARIKNKGGKNVR
jgi:hypothetical protein